MDMRRKPCLFPCSMAPSKSLNDFLFFFFFSSDENNFRSKPRNSDSSFASISLPVRPQRGRFWLPFRNSNEDGLKWRRMLFPIDQAHRNIMHDLRIACGIFGDISQNSRKNWTKVSDFKFALWQGNVILNQNLRVCFRPLFFHTPWIKNLI